MQAFILTLNAGSSSLKFSTYRNSRIHVLERVFHGQIKLLEKPKFIVKNNLNEIIEEKSINANNIREHSFKFVFDWLMQKSIQINAVGHRIVHGAHLFMQSTIIDQAVLAKLETLIPLAPLHQPYNLEGIKQIQKLFPQLLQVACFDTAFHSSQPTIAQSYALPTDITTIPIKRYGFHGLSYEYIKQSIPHYFIPSGTRKMIVAHLGHGASMCAMLDGISIATTMGFTALDGLPMGTRCGNIDPGIILYLLQQGYSENSITDILYNQSGLLGVSQLSSDIRTLLASTSEKASNAIELFIYRLKRELGSLVAALQGLDCLIFTAGIGENSPVIRKRLCDKLDWLGIILNEQSNNDNELLISAENSKITVWVIPTNEELIIAQDTLELM